MTKFGQSRIRLKDLNPNSTYHIFLGPNGAGKSMSLLELEHEISEKYNNGMSYTKLGNKYVNWNFGDSEAKINIPVYHYQTKQNDIVQNSFNFDPYKLMSAFRSEGERMDDSFMDWASNAWVHDLLAAKPKEYYLLIDEMDSGLSFDRINIQIFQLISIINHEIKQGHKPHVIITCNSYELLETLQSKAKDLSIYWVPTKKEIEIDSYKTFRNLYKSRLNKLLKELKEEE